MPAYPTRTRAIVAVLLALALSTSPVNAESDLFARLDTDGDGQIATSEIPDEHATLFRRLLRTADANSDGLLSAKEFREGISPTRPEKPLTEKGNAEFPGADALLLILAWMDENSDLTIKAEEVPPHLKPFYDQVQQQLKSKDSSQFRVRQLQQQSPGFAQQALRYSQRQKIDVELELSLLSDQQHAMVERLRKNVEPGQALASADNAEALFARLDQDGDGVILIADLPEGPRERFAEMLERADHNSDQRITEEEFLSFRGQAAKMTANKPVRPQSARRVAQLLRRADRNGDGQLTRREAPPFIAERFDKVDSNGDGLLNHQELSQLLMLQSVSAKASRPTNEDRTNSSIRPKN
ncbi:EF-hand domain-containing protein [Bythopirellula polymerisocia]|uniref:Transaldolase/EF-hand domain-containing protein n=1 Tax=Bythopirellula polymerisocia TaxID=2528003 RepID=A0A5C6CMH1_9BACT|nr:EF-hand domain-containing protein [Bythopirellula polymerisocia]TWU24664.1 transaldolase/EF-hand domain-containing protein [Bythopirellula polymerisocia]